MSLLRRASARVIAQPRTGSHAPLSSPLPLPSSASTSYAAPLSHSAYTLSSQPHRTFRRHKYPPPTPYIPTPPSSKPAAAAAAAPTEGAAEGEAAEEAATAASATAAEAAEPSTPELSDDEKAAEQTKITAFLQRISPEAVELADKFTTLQQVLTMRSRRLKLDLSIPVPMRRLIRKEADRYITEQRIKAALVEYKQRLQSGSQQQQAAAQ